MQIKEINVSRPVCFNIGQQYSNEVLVIHFKGLPDLPNKYIYVKKDNYEKEVPLVGDLYVVSRPLTTYSGEVKAQIIARDPRSTPIALTPNFKMMITPSNYSGIGEDENYPDDPNIKNYYVKIDGKIQSMDELIALVQSKLDNGEFIGAQGPKGEKGDPGPKGEPGDVTEEYRNLASQIAQNASDAQASATNAKVSATNAQKALDDTKGFVNQTKTELNQIKTDTSALKDEANTSAVNAKASEDKAKKYADNLKESTDAISQNTKAISDLKDKKITKFYASNQGETHIADSDKGLIQDMMIYGKSSQDGTPSQDNPVEIKSVVNPTIKVFGKNILQPNLWYGNRVKMNIKKGVTLTILCKNGQVSHGGNIKFEKANGDVVWFGFESGNAKQQIQLYDDVIAYYYLIDLVPSENYALYIGDENTYEPYKEQSIQLPITLNAIPVSSGGNVTINGQQYIADYVDVERGKVVRKVDSSKLDNTQSIIDKTEWLLAEQQETDLTTEQIESLKMLSTYYPVTNITVGSEQLDGYTVFNYPISLANGWNYVKQQLNDNRDYIYDMDLQSAEAFVNSEYAVTLTELEV